MFDPNHHKVYRRELMRSRGPYSNDTESFFGRRRGAKARTPAPRGLKNILLFRGAVGPKGYWLTLIGGIAVWLVLWQLDPGLGCLNTFISGYLVIAIVAARLRDIGLSGWLAPIVLILTPLCGGFILYVLGRATTEDWL